MLNPTRGPKNLNTIRITTDRFGEAGVLGTSLHVEGLDLHRKSTQQDGLINGVRHQSLRSFWDILRLNKTSLTLTARKATRQKQLFHPVAALHLLHATPWRTHTRQTPHTRWKGQVFQTQIHVLKNASLLNEL